MSRIESFGLPLIGEETQGCSKNISWSGPKSRTTRQFGFRESIRWQRPAQTMRSAILMLTAVTRTLEPRCHGRLETTTAAMRSPSPAAGGFAFLDLLDTRWADCRLELGSHPDELAPGTDSELGVCICEMALNGPIADVQLVGNLGSRISLNR